MLLKNLLIPIDFTTNTDTAINKAIELIDTENAVIHLLHVNNNLYSRLTSPVHTLIPFTKTEMVNYEKENHNLEKLKMKVARSLPGVIVQAELALGRIEKNIIKACKAINPDIIIIGKHRHQRLLPFLNTVSPERIARRTGCAVLTLKSGSPDQQNRVIVVPIDNFIAKKKIDLLTLLSKKYNVKIHLVSLSSTINSLIASNAMLQTYRMLRSRGLHTQVIYKTVKGTNLTRSTLKYAESIMADMLLINNETEQPVASIKEQPATANRLKKSKPPITEVKPFSFLYLK